MNRAARALLGVEGANATSQAGPVWQALLAAHGDWRARGAPAGQVVEPLSAGDGATRRRLRLRFLRPADAGTGSVVMVEDLARVESRAQQLKLASMGRLSASIAHEIRNPLAAIRHANGLLAEGLDEPGLRRLAAIVESNSLRIDRIVEDVLSVARRERAATEPIDLHEFLPAFLAEHAAAQPAAARVRPDLQSRRPLHFDPNHLRQILVNLVDNAIRHASAAPGAVRLAWRDAGDGRLELAVIDDGPGLSEEQAQHVFEPFHTSEARGTGLGLFLARELCAANGAAIRYERRPGPPPRSAFVIATGTGAGA